MEGRQELALDFDELDAVGFLEKRFHEDAIELQPHWAGRGRIQDDFRRDGEDVARRPAEADGVGIKIHHGLHRPDAFGNAIQRYRITEGVLVDHKRLARLPAFDVPGKERLRPKPRRAALQIGRAGLEEHDVDAAGERSAWAVLSKWRWNSSRAGRHKGRGPEKKCREEPRPECESWNRFLAACGGSGA